MNNARRHRGFTFIELIIALAMISVLSIALYRAMNSALKSRDKALATIEASRTVSIAADIVRQDLESVPPPTGTLAGPFVGIHQPGGAGDEDTLEFCGIGTDQSNDDSPLSEGMRRITWSIRADMSPPALVRSVTRNLMPSAEAPPAEEIICRDVRSFSLRYFDGTSWQENWDSTTIENALPLAIAITVEINDAAAGGEPSRISRVIPLSCSKPSDATLSIGGGLP